MQCSQLTCRAGDQFEDYRETEQNPRVIGGEQNKQRVEGCSSNFKAVTGCHRSDPSERGSLIPIFEQTQLRPPAQLVQSLSNLIPRRFTSITTFAVWAVEFHEGQQVALPA
jgi:hypothetical protein